MGLISELQEFVQMDSGAQIAVFRALQSAMVAPYSKPNLFPREIHFEEDATPRERVSLYLAMNRIHLPAELEQDINWPKLYQTLVKRGLIIPVEDKE